MTFSPYDKGNHGLSLRQVQNSGGVKSVNEIPTLSLLIIESPMAIHFFLQKQMI